VSVTGDGKAYYSRPTPHAASSFDAPRHVAL